MSMLASWRRALWRKKFLTVYDAYVKDDDKSHSYWKMKHSRVHVGIYIRAYF